MNAERDAAGEERIINLGIGAPDGMPPAAAIDALKESASQPGNHAYQSYTGIPQLRQAFAQWYSRYYGVALNTTEVNGNTAFYADKSLIVPLLDILAPIIASSAPEEYQPIIEQFLPLLANATSVDLGLTFQKAE